jgi:hypothetical protein
MTNQESTKDIKFIDQVKNDFDSYLQDQGLISLDALMNDSRAEAQEGSETPPVERETPTRNNEQRPRQSRTGEKPRGGRSEPEPSKHSK